MDFSADVYLSEPYRFGIWFLQNMVSKTTQHRPHPLPATHCLYILYFDTLAQERGVGGR